VKVKNATEVPLLMLLCSCYGYNPVTQTFTLKTINSLRNYSNEKRHYLKHCV